MHASDLGPSPKPASPREINFAPESSYPCWEAPRSGMSHWDRPAVAESLTPALTSVGAFHAEESICAHQEAGLRGFEGVLADQPQPGAPRHSRREMKRRMLKEASKPKISCVRLSSRHNERPTPFPLAEARCQGKPAPKIQLSIHAIKHLVDCRSGGAGQAVARCSGGRPNKRGHGSCGGRGGQRWTSRSSCVLITEAIA
jgi:hypothetical protein